MAPRLTRRSVIALGIEATYGGTVATFLPMLLTGTPEFTIDPDVVPRDLVRGYYGASEELTGTRRSILKFSTELAGSTALGTAPPWGLLMRAAGFAETLTASTRVEYTPITQAQESVGVKFNRDGVQYLCRGARATAKFNMMAYERPTIDWEVWGFDTAASEVAVGSPAYNPWVRPLVITDANSGNIKLGSTYAAGAISAGTTYNSRGMTLDIGNTLAHMKMLGNEAIEIIDRNISGQMLVELDTATEVTWRTDINANTLTSQSFNIGPATQNVAFFNANVQRTKPQMVDYQGKLLMQTDLRMLPLATGGNDETRIIIK